MEETISSLSHRNSIRCCRILTGFLIATLTSVGQSATRASWQENELSVKAEDYGFMPAFVTVAVGTMVTWTNIDPELHTVTSDDGGFNGSIGPGEAFSVRFPEAGVFFYYCQPHDWMIGEITVVAEPRR